MPANTTPSFYYQIDAPTYETSPHPPGRISIGGGSRLINFISPKPGGKDLRRKALVVTEAFWGQINDPERPELSREILKGQLRWLEQRAGFTIIDPDQLLPKTISQSRSLDLMRHRPTRLEDFAPDQRLALSVDNFGNIVGIDSLDIHQDILEPSRASTNNGESYDLQDCQLLTSEILARVLEALPAVGCEQVLDIRDCLNLTEGDALPPHTLTGLKVGYTGSRLSLLAEDGNIDPYTNTYASLLSKLMDSAQQPMILIADTLLTNSPITPVQLDTRSCEAIEIVNISMWDENIVPQPIIDEVRKLTQGGSLFFIAGNTNKPLITYFPGDADHRLLRSIKASNSKIIIDQDIRPPVFPSVTIIDLDRCVITSNTLSTLINGANLLSVLKLKNTYILEADDFNISKQSLSQLQELDLSNSEMEGKQLKQLLKQSLGTLKKLILNNCIIRGKISFKDMALPELVEISLAGVKFQDDNEKRNTAAVAELMQITTKIISVNLDGTDLTEIPFSEVSLSSLMSLYLRNTKITASQLANILSQCSETLRTLMVDGFSLQGSIERLNRPLCELECFSAEGSNLTKESFESLIYGTNNISTLNLNKSLIREAKTIFSSGVFDSARLKSLIYSEVIGETGFSRYEITQRSFNWLLSGYAIDLSQLITILTHPLEKTVPLLFVDVEKFHLRFNKMVFTGQVIPLRHKKLEITSLGVSFSNITDQQLLQLLIGSSERLERLSLGSSTINEENPLSLPPGSLPSLHSLDLRYLKNLSALSLKNLFKAAPNLEKITLPSGWVVLVSQLRKATEVSPKNRGISADNSLEIFIALYFGVRLQKLELVCDILSLTSVDLPLDPLSLPNVKLLRIQRDNTNSKVHDCKDGLLTILEAAPAVKELSLKLTPTQDISSSLNNNLPQCDSLVIEGGEITISCLIQKLATAKQLKRLSLTYCCIKTDCEIPVDILADLSIEELDLSNSHYSEDLLFMLLQASQSSLKRLDINGSNIGQGILSNNLSNHIISLSRLKDVQCTRCQFTNSYDNFIQDLCKLSPQLDSLTILSGLVVDISLLKETRAIIYDPYDYSTEKYHNDKTLSGEFYGSNDDLRDKDIAILIDWIGNITKLVIASDINKQEKNYTTTLEKLKSATTLTELRLYYVNDEGVVFKALKDLPNLQKLELREISDEDYDFRELPQDLADAKLSKLVELDLSLPKFDALSLRFICDKAPNLNKLTVTRCDLLSNYYFSLPQGSLLNLHEIYFGTDISIKQLLNFCHAAPDLYLISFSYMNIVTRSSDSNLEVGSRLQLEGDTLNTLLNKACQVDAEDAVFAYLKTISGVATAHDGPSTSAQTLYRSTETYQVQGDTSNNRNATINSQQHFWGVDGTLPDERMQRLRCFDRLDILETHAGKPFVWHQPLLELRKPLSQVTLSQQDDVFHQATLAQEKDSRHHHYYGKVVLSGPGWHALPSLSANETLHAMHLDPPVQIEIQYSTNHNQYFIKLPKNCQTVTVDYHLSTPPEPEVACLPSALQPVILDYQTYGEGALKLASNASGKDVLQAIRKQRVGHCQHRSVALVDSLGREHSSLKWRMVKSDSHNFIEVYQDDRWVKIDLGGYAAKKQLDKSLTPPGWQAKSSSAQVTEAGNATMPLGGPDIEPPTSSSSTSERGLEDDPTNTATGASQTETNIQPASTREPLDGSASEGTTLGLGTVTPDNSLPLSQQDSASSQTALPTIATVQASATVPIKNTWQDIVSPEAFFKPQFTLPNDLQAAAKKILVPGAPENLLLTGNASDLRLLREAIATESATQGIPSYYADKPAQLLCTATTVELDADCQRGIVREPAPGAGPFFRFIEGVKASKSCVLIDLTKFSAQALVGLNPALDQQRRWDGDIARPRGMQVLSFYDPQVSGYDGEDVHSRYTTWHVPSLTQAANEADTDDVVPPFTIECYGDQDWQTRLLGEWQLKGQEIYFKKGPLLQAIEQDHTVVKLSNAPWDNDEFAYFIHQAITCGYFNYAGQRFVLPQGFRYTQSSGYDLTTLTSVVVDHTAELTQPPTPYHCLNPALFSQWLVDYTLDKGHLHHKPGLIERYGSSQEPHQPLDVLVTDSLAAHQWLELQARCYQHNVRLRLWFKQEVTPPYGLSNQQVATVACEPAEHYCSQPVDRHSSYYHSDDPDLTVQQLVEALPDACVITVSEREAGALLGQIDVPDEQAGKPLSDFSFLYRPGVLTELLAQGKTVILKGPLNESLAQSLQAFFSARRQQADDTGQVILVDKKPCPYLGITSYYHHPSREAYLNALGLASPDALNLSVEAFDQYSLAELAALQRQAKPWQGMCESASTATPYAGRLPAVLAMLATSPLVVLTGISGVGKTQFIRGQLAEHVKLYEIEAFEAWLADDTADRDVVLFIDEANQDDASTRKRLSQLEDLFNPNPSVTDRHYHPLKRQKVVCAINPVSFGGVRTFPNLFKHGGSVPFDRLPLQHLRDNINAPVLADLADNSRACDAIMAVLSFLYQVSIDDSITPREPITMARLTRQFCQRHPSADVGQVAAYYAYQLAYPLVPDGTRSLFEQNFAQPRPPVDEAVRPAPDMHINPKNTNAYHLLCDFLTQHRDSDSAQLSVHAGLGGMVITGPPGTGKSKLVEKTLAAFGYGDEQVCRLSPSMADDERARRLQAAGSGRRVIWIEEFNVGDVERLLIEVLARFPDALIVGTQNAATYAGRNKTTQAILHRFCHVEVRDYQANDMLEILQQTLPQRYHPVIPTFINVYESLKATRRLCFRDLEEALKKYVEDAEKKRRQVTYVEASKAEQILAALSLFGEPSIHQDDTLPLAKPEHLPTSVASPKLVELNEALDDSETSGPSAQVKDIQALLQLAQNTIPKLEENATPPMSTLVLQQLEELQQPLSNISVSLDEGNIELLGKQLHAFWQNLVKLGAHFDRSEVGHLASEYWDNFLAMVAILGYEVRPRNSISAQDPSDTFEECADIQVLWTFGSLKRLIDDKFRENSNDSLALLLKEWWPELDRIENQVNTLGEYLTQPSPVIKRELDARCQQFLKTLSIAIETNQPSVLRYALRHFKQDLVDLTTRCDKATVGTQAMNCWDSLYKLVENLLNAVLWVLGASEHNAMTWFDTPMQRRLRQLETKVGGLLDKSDRLAQPIPPQTPCLLNDDEFCFQRRLSLSQVLNTETKSKISTLLSLASQELTIQVTEKRYVEPDGYFFYRIEPVVHRKFVSKTSINTISQLIEPLVKDHQWLLLARLMIGCDDNILMRELFDSCQSSLPQIFDCIDAVHQVHLYKRIETLQPDLLSNSLSTSRIACFRVGALVLDRKNNYTAIEQGIGDILTKRFLFPSLAHQWPFRATCNRLLQYAIATAVLENRQELLGPLTKKLIPEGDMNVLQAVYSQVLDSIGDHNCQAFSWLCEQCEVSSSQEDVLQMT